MTRAVLLMALVVGAARADDPAGRVVGELVAVDFVHRTGQFRTAAGVLTDFTLVPDAAVEAVNAPADLRDLPLGTAFEFTLSPDADGKATRATAVRDRFTTDTRAGGPYRVEGVAAGTLRLSRGGTPAAFRITDRTRVRKGDKAVPPADLAAGDEVLVNVTGATPEACSEIWAGRDEQTRATDRQREQHAKFVQARGLPARVDRTDGKALTLILFAGELAAFPKAWAADVTKPGKGVHVCVANDELRTWNPEVDQEQGRVVEGRPDPAGGVRLVVTVNFPLEGFRRGRYVRVFPDGWRTVDQPFGEQLFHYGSRALPPDLAEQPAKEYPDQFPFRTDSCNAHLPWYRVKPGVAPPAGAEHRVWGELVSADGRAGRFRADATGDETAFTLLPDATVRALGDAATLADIPPGTRCRYSTYQDDAGAFRLVGAVADDASDQIGDEAVWRVEALFPAAGVIVAARQPPGVRNDQGDPEQPPDTGRAELRVGPDTRVWKAGQWRPPGVLAVGERLVVNRTGDRPGHPAVCTHIWVGADLRKRLTAPPAKAPVERNPR